MKNLTAPQLDLIVAALAFTDMERLRFQDYLIIQGHSDTAENATSEELNSLRIQFTEEYHKELEK